jgi:hypothetical protein
MSSMKKLLLAGTAVCLMVVAVLIAGCTTTTTNNTTTTSPTQGTQPTTVITGATNVSQYLTVTMQNGGFAIVMPFSRQATMQNGAVPYSGVVSDANGTYNLTYEVFTTPQAAQARYQELVNGYVTHGYTTMQQNSTVWSGFNSASSMGAGVSYGTSPLMPYYVGIMVGYSKNPQAPFQPSAWSHTWGGMWYCCMGPYMGYNISPEMREHMQEEMREHMDGTPYGGPYGEGPMMGGERLTLITEECP